MSTFIPTKRIKSLRPGPIHTNKIWVKRTEGPRDVFNCKVSWRRSKSFVPSWFCISILAGTQKTGCMNSTPFSEWVAGPHSRTYSVIRTSRALSVLTASWAGSDHPPALQGWGNSTELPPDFLRPWAGTCWSQDAKAIPSDLIPLLWPVQDPMARKPNWCKET